MAPPFSSTNYDIVHFGSSSIINNSITNADIALGTIELNNLSASCIASLSGGGGGLTANSVDSSHIINGSILTIDICDNAITYEKIAANAVTNTKIANDSVSHAKLTGNCIQSHNIVDGTILGTDICDNTITGSKIAVGTITSSNILDRTILGIDISLGQISEAHFDASFNTQLEEFGDIIKELSRPFGVIRIINQSLTETNFNYDLYVYNAVSEVYDLLVSAIRLKKSDSFSHFYQVANKYTTMKLNVDSTGGISVEAFNIIQGAENVNEDGNELIFQIGESTNYQNIEIGVEVAI